MFSAVSMEYGITHPFEWKTCKKHFWIFRQTSKQIVQQNYCIFLLWTDISVLKKCHMRSFITLCHILEYGLGQNHFFIHGLESLATHVIVSINFQYNFTTRCIWERGCNWKLVGVESEPVLMNYQIYFKEITKQFGNFCNPRHSTFCNCIFIGVKGGALQEIDVLICMNTSEVRGYDIII